ncbi:MAG: hypothetical protein H6706_13220 [Myxococcales bacterium]|nr:hypothetical protein [Myxococcales bacterium]
MLPSVYFTNQREAALADLIWARAQTYNLQGFHGATKLPWASTRVIKACGLAIEMRYNTVDLGEPARRCFPKEKANVEHFWCGAMLGTVGGPFGLVGGTALNFVYDGIISPLSKVFSGNSFDKIVDGIKNDYKQFAGPDTNGVKFGAIHHTRFFWMDRD